MRQRVVAAVIALVAGVAIASTATAAGNCPPRGVWLDPAGGEHLDAQRLLTRIAREEVVLLGEQHAQPEHQRWQLHTLAALHGLRPQLVLGLEMFPRRVQPALDRWVAGELDEQAFLRESDWDSVWGYDPVPYLPVFHFARMHRIPMVALNVDREVMARIRARGFDQVPREQRDGVGQPVDASPEYRAILAQVFQHHAGPAGHHGAQTEAEADANLERFIQAQLTWDRAMAEALHGAAQGEGRPLVVGLMGSGHVEHRHGVPAQLADLGVERKSVLLAWPEDARCEQVVAGLADGVFGLQRRAEPERARLGVLLTQQQGGVRVDGVEADGIGAAAGLRKGDLILRAAGQAVRAPRDVVAIVRAQPPGSWLPLEVQRGDGRAHLVAKFPVP